MLTQGLLKQYISEKSNELILIRMFLGFGVAMFSITPALFFKYLGFSDSAIGFITAIITLISLIISIASTIILEKINEYKLFRISILVPLISLFFLIIYPTIFVYIVFLIVSVIFSTIRGNSFSILFKDITSPSQFTKKESLMYSLLNIGWFIGPLIAALLIENYGFRETFFLAAVFYLISFILALMVKVKLKKKSRKKLIRI